MRPPFSSRTVTSPWASVPLVMAFTEYSCSSVPLCNRLDGLEGASTGPLPKRRLAAPPPSTAR
jgi:hypothetical protein